MRSLPLIVGETGGKGAGREHGGQHRGVEVAGGGGPLGAGPPRYCLPRHRPSTRILGFRFLN